MRETHADCRDLKFAVTVNHPNPDPAVAALAAYIEGCQSGYQPRLQAGHIGADIAASRLEIEHHIGNALAGTVVGVLAAAPGDMDRQSRRVN